MAASFWGMAQERPEMNELPPLEDGPDIPIINRIPAIATDRPDITESAQITPVVGFSTKVGTSIRMPRREYP